MSKKNTILGFLLLMAIAIQGGSGCVQASNVQSSTLLDTIGYVPEYTGQLSEEVNGSVPFFDEEEKQVSDLLSFGALDSLGRCTGSMGCAGPETLADGNRGEIGFIQPSGWVQNKYEGIVDSTPPFLYNRSHLVMWALFGDETNVAENLITGTRLFNASDDGMLGTEVKVIRYIENTGNHVLYRVTPLFCDDELLARGVLIEASSIEDQGSGLSLCTFVHNVQPGITIDYLTGDNALAQVNDATEINAAETGDTSSQYVLNTNTKRFHYPTCKSVEDIKEKNKDYFQGSREALIAQGYRSCGNCNP